MAKRKKIVKQRQIDHIPKCFQQPRSPPRKRRTDFSFFFCSSSSSSSSRSYSRLHQDYSSGKDGLSNVTTASLNDRKNIKNVMPRHSLLQCKKLEERVHGLFSNFFEVPLTKAQSVPQNELSHPSKARNVDEQKSDTAQTLNFSPNKYHVADSSNICVTPGSVVWAKMACQVWWPAEIMEERSTLANSRNEAIDGHVLVRYYGKHQSAWVDPASDLSQLEDCFEERSCNPMEDFQKALKQALWMKEQKNSIRKLFGSPDGPNNSDHLDQLSDKWNSSCSSRTEDDCLEKRRGKRQRKPKVRFDEVTFPLKPARKVRRFRIMRYLGLAAPIGSPF